MGFALGAQALHLIEVGAQVEPAAIGRRQPGRERLRVMAEPCFASMRCTSGSAVCRQVVPQARTRTRCASE